MRASSKLTLALSLVLTSLLACDSAKVGEDTSTTVFSTADVVPTEGTWTVNNNTWERDDCGASLMLSVPEAVTFSDATESAFTLSLVFPEVAGISDLGTTCTLEGGAFVCVEAYQYFTIYSSEVDLGATVTGSLSSTTSGRMSAELSLGCTGPECMGFDGCVLINSADITHDP